MDQPGPVGLVVVLLVASLAVSTGGAVGSDVSDPNSLSTQGEFDQTVFDITVYANGSGHWTFSYRQTLENESEKEEFRAFAARFNENETELYTRFQSRARSLVDNGENVTGREMTATKFSKQAQVTGLDGNRGVVEMSFLWTGFGEVDGKRVIVGDVFEGGLYIGPDQVLTITQGPDLVVYESEPMPADQSDDTLTYLGEQSFADNRPRVVFGPPQAAGSETPTTDPSTSPGSSPESTPDGAGGMGLFPMAALFIALLLGVGAAYAYRTGTNDSAPAAATTDDDGGDGGAAAESDPEPEPAISDEELLSDEDRVMQMLDERGGRMKQVNIVEETGWSKSKVSMLLSDMEDDGVISKLRVGRENIISKKGMEPDAAKSPFDDDE